VGWFPAANHPKRLARIIFGNEAIVSRSRGARRLALVAGIASVVVLAGCVSPAINVDGYRGKVSQSAKKMVGLVNAARLAAQLDLDGKMLHTITDNVVTDAEKDAQSVLSALDSVQPPDESSIKLRSNADDVLQQAASQLADLRIAVRRRDQPSMRSTLGDLGKTLADVQHVQDVT
jgi:hypothetical protein